MKKLAALFIVLAFLVQIFCCPMAIAETTTSGETEKTTVVTEDTTVETTEQTTSTTENTTQNEGENTTTQATTTKVTTTQSTGLQSIKTRLIILDYQGKLAVRLTDEKNAPVAGVTVKIQVISTVLNATTDENGYAILRIDMPEKGTYIHCSTEDTTIDGIVYLGTAASTGSQNNATTTTSQENTTETQVEAETATTTASPTYNRTTKVTSSQKTTVPPTWYTYAATTGLEASYVSLGFCFDNGILSTFKTDETAFYNTARLLLTPESYATIIGDMKGTLLMAAASSAAEVTDEQITNAFKDDALLSRTNAKDIDRVVVDLSLQLQSPTGKRTDVWSLAVDSYVIQLPIPHSLRSAKAIAVAAVTADGISELVYTTVSKDGFLRFDTTNPTGTIVLLGLKNNILTALTGDSAIIAIIFLVLGLLCIGGAVFLYIYFFLLPRRSKKKETVEEKTTVSPNDFPVFESTAPTSSDQSIDPLDTLDIFMDANDSDDSGSSPNIDIPL